MPPLKTLRPSLRLHGCSAAVAAAARLRPCCILSIGQVGKDAARPKRPGIGCCSRSQSPIRALQPITSSDLELDAAVGHSRQFEPYLTEYYVVTSPPLRCGLGFGASKAAAYKFTTILSLATGPPAGRRTGGWPL